MPQQYMRLAHGLANYTRLANYVVRHISASRGSALERVPRNKFWLRVASSLEFLQVQCLRYPRLNDVLQEILGFEGGWQHVQQVPCTSAHTPVRQHIFVDMQSILSWYSFAKLAKEVHQLCS